MFYSQLFEKVLPPQTVVMASVFFYSLRPRWTGIKESIQVQPHLNLKSTPRTPLANFPYDIIFQSRLAASLETTLLPWPGNRFLSRENGGQILVACSNPAFRVYSTRFFPGKVYAGKVCKAESFALAMSWIIAGFLALIFTWDFCVLLLNEIR